MTWPLLIFDLDGTLIDSAADIASALNKTLLHYEKPTLSHDVVVAHIGEGLRKLLADFFPEHKDRPPEEYQHIEEHFLKIYETEMYKSTRPFPGAIDFLQNYKGPVGIVTNKNESPARKILHHLGMAHIPWIAVFGADTLTERKPHPLPLQTMMKLAEKTTRASLMIGDGKPDMQAAQSAGIGAIAVRFGYTKLEILEEYDPIAVLDDYAELQNLIQRLINH